MNNMINSLPADLTEYFGDAICVASDGAWELSLAPEQVRAAMEFLGLQREPAFDYFINVAGVDYGDEIEVFWQVSQVCSADIVRVTTRVSRRGGAVPTVTDIWPGAGWPERELMEMFGVTVTDTPDPRHLLLPQDWKGFPLRKDYVYPDHPWLTRDPIHEDPKTALGE